MKTNLLRTDVASEYSDYLRDESRKKGKADTISFPVSEEDIRQVMAAVHGGGLAVTTQGGRTGITGGAVPNGGHLLSTSRMNRVTGMRYDAAREQLFITVQPGLALNELRKVLRQRTCDTSGWTPGSLEAFRLFGQSGEWFFPPDPTETSASLGGMVACNASGACTFHYGPTRDYVEALRVVLADGKVLDLRRGREQVSNRRFSVTTADGATVLQGQVPSYAMPAVKNAAGFYARSEMDLLDLFVGSEGTLGVFSEIELRLLPAPACRWGVMVFLPSDETATRFVNAVRSGDCVQRPVAIEFFDVHALALLRRQRASNPAFAEIPDLPASYYCAVYVEYHGHEDAVTAAVDDLPGRINAAGGVEEATWVATSEAELERLKFFRHAVPEAVNLTIDERRKREPELTKLGTDMAVPDKELETVLAMYRHDLERAGLEYVLFGHVGNNHVHVNILPRSLQEYGVGKDLYLQWARRVVASGGTVSAEHGIGKFKVAMLREMFGEGGIREMREVKRVFDPDGKLNPGNLF